MRDMWKLAAALLACTILVGGCNDDERRESKGGGFSVFGPADTPKGTIVNLAQAMKQGDAQGVANCYDVTGEGKELLEQLIAAQVKMEALHRAGIEAYGETEWRRTMGSMRGIMPMAPRVEDVGQDLKVDIRGDTASCRAGRSRWNLVNRDGLWRIKFDCPPEKHRDQIVIMIDASVEAAEDAMVKVGRPGVTLREILEDYNETMSDAMRRASKREKDRDRDRETDRDTKRFGRPFF